MSDPGGLLVLLVFRALVPWVLVAVVVWWIWKAVRRSFTAPSGLSRPDPLQ